MQIPVTEEVGFISSGGGVGGGGGGLLVLVYRYTGGGIVSARHISLLFVRVRSISLLLSRRREKRLTPSSYVRTSTVNRPRADLILAHCRRVPLLPSFPSFFFSPFSSLYFLFPRLPPNAVRRPVRQRDRVRRKRRVFVIGANHHVKARREKRRSSQKARCANCHFHCPVSLSRINFYVREHRRQDRSSRAKDCSKVSAIVFSDFFKRLSLILSGNASFSNYILNLR